MSPSRPRRRQAARAAAPRARRARGRSLVGERHVVEVTAFAHGGAGVARLGEDAGEAAGTVVFVRHALPGERVVAQVTEGTLGDRWVRADAVAVERAADGRVTPPCPHAHPGGCGGCDLQHASLPTQRALKTAVLAEQLRRLAGWEREVPVEPVPGDEDGLAWRTRMRYHRTPSGDLGLRRHRSRTVEPVGACLVQAPGAVVTVEGEPPADGAVTEEVRGRRFEVAADGFWQVHRGAPALLTEVVTDFAGVTPGDRVLDLYAGVGLLSAFLAEAAGPGGALDAVEGDATAASYAERNLAAYPQARVHAEGVERALGEGVLRSRYDVVVLDPPRAGARRPVIEGVLARSPRTVVLVGCDPAAFARDLALLTGGGLLARRLRAFDLFPMTHHLEAVAEFSRPEVS